MTISRGLRWLVRISPRGRQLIVGTNRGATRSMNRVHPEWMDVSDRVGGAGSYNKPINEYSNGISSHL